jgi:hypothetical protein
MAEFRDNRWGGRVLGVGSLVAAGLILAALFPPFATLDCPGCSARVPLVSGALRYGADAWAVLWIVGVLAVTATLFLAGMAIRLMAALNAVAALAALGLSIFDGVMAIPRVLNVAASAYGYPVSGPLDPGYYLFLFGGALAVAAAAAMLLWGGTGGKEVIPRVLRSRGRPVAGWACLASLAVAIGGAFVPFATAACGPCHFFLPPAGSFSGTLAGTVDGRVVLGLLVAAGMATAAGLAGRRPPLTSTAALLLALAAAAVVSFDSLNAGSRVLGWPYAIGTLPGQGYYLLQAGSAAAAVLALLRILADRPRWPSHRRPDLGLLPGMRPA